MYQWSSFCGGVYLITTLSVLLSRGALAVNAGLPVAYWPLLPSTDSVLIPPGPYDHDIPNLWLWSCQN